MDYNLEPPVIPRVSEEENRIRLSTNMLKSGEADNADNQLFNQIIFTIGDDQSTTTYLISNVELDNRGFHNTAAQALPQNAAEAAVHSFEFSQGL